MNTTAVKTDRTLVAAGTSNAAGGTTRATLDLRTALGGLLTLKITNGATGPSGQCVGRVLAAHAAGATPAAGGAGSVWKTLYDGFGGGTAANAVSEMSYQIDPAVMHLEVEFAGNTGQAVTVEAYLSELTSYSAA